MTQLYRVKIRLYNQVFPTKKTPEGQFQGFFDVDCPLTDLGEPNVDYWLTQKEIKECKKDMHLEFNQPIVWNPDETKLTYYIEGLSIYGGKGFEGIPYRGDIMLNPAKYGIKQIPKQFLGKVTIEDLVVGISTVAPQETDEPRGSYKERLMVLKDDQINWDSGALNILTYAITEADLIRWRGEA
jgi:hypothetical protein